jgi:hypothetical protein
VKEWQVAVSHEGDLHDVHDWLVGLQKAILSHCDENFRESLNRFVYSVSILIYEHFILPLVEIEQV